MLIIDNIDALKQLIQLSTDKLFVRWSCGYDLDVAQKQSRDYAAGSTHNGLSSVEIDSDWTTDDKWLARRITEYRFLRMKNANIDCHIYMGDIVGVDSDGYELISNISPVCTLSNDLITILCGLKNE